MTKPKEETTVVGALEVQINDADVHDAMTRIPGYLDISVEDFQDIYRLAFTHAMERMLHGATAEQIMLPGVTALNPSDHLVSAANRMAADGASLAVVVDAEDRVIGVVTESDFLRALDSRGLMSLLAGQLYRSQDLHARLARRQCADIMSSPPVTIQRGAGLGPMLQTFKTSSCERYPVVDDSQRAVGLLTRKRFVQACHLQPGD